MEDNKIKPQIPVCSPPNLFKLLYRNINKDSAEPILDENGKEIISSPTLSRAYHFTAIVQDTNRPAFSQYVCIIRPQSYVYAEKIIELINPDGTSDVNAPVLFFDATKRLLLKLSSTNDLHRVWIVGEKIL